jgi:hypothetical protein
MGERREYQVATVRKALKEKRGIIAAATGAGKTVMMKAIVQALNLKTIVMVPTAALLTQTHRSFKASDFDVGMVGGGHADFDKPVVVATAQSLYARLAREGDLAEKLSEFGLFFFDECHQAQAETYWDVIMECEAPYRFGLSGTPLRNDIRKDFRLVGAIDPSSTTFGSSRSFSRASWRSLRGPSPVPTRRGRPVVLPTLRPRLQPPRGRERGEERSRREGCRVARPPRPHDSRCGPPQEARQAASEAPRRGGREGTVGLRRHMLGST